MGTEKRCCGQPRTKEREYERSIPSSLSYFPLQLSFSLSPISGLLGKISEKKKKKIVCQQSSGYTVHPVLFPPNSKLPLWNADSRGGAEIHFTLQGKIHSAWIASKNANSAHIHYKNVIFGREKFLYMTKNARWLLPFDGWMSGFNCLPLNRGVAQSRRQVTTCRCW